MNTGRAAKALSALAHTTRLDIFRILVKEGPVGLPAGEISARLNIQPPALSFHLSHLERTGLVQMSRAGRNCIYAIEVAGMRDLLEFLTEDCCDGHPEICGSSAPAKRTSGKTRAKGAAQ